ncbi:MAG: hypothetical protein GX127_04370 [Eubacteriaceae bacterium]|jgi:hypothetical protein|nr:hypothetical protein [Eubacteriaceae bacterium]
MKKYEVIREIYNACSDTWQIDYRFSPFIDTKDPESYLRETFGEELRIEELSAESSDERVFIVHKELPEKYFFLLA